MLKQNKFILSCLLALGIVLAQWTMTYAEYDHPLHVPDGKCSVCLVAGHLSHAVTSSALTFDVEQFSPLAEQEFDTSLRLSFSTPYLIRGPPQS